MSSWITPSVAVFLMLLGVIGSTASMYIIFEFRYNPGVLWFIVSMGTGAAWAFLFAMMTLISSPTITLILANFFWTVIPIAAVSLFLLAYEFVFNRTVSHRGAALVFSPVAVFFILTWFNPANMIYTSEYTVTSQGFLDFPQIGGIIHVLVTQVYGYLLVFLAAGMFVGEAMRTRGIQRRQTIYLLVLFSILVGSTAIKVAGRLPIYYDLTSTVYGFSGLLFAYSINRYGFLKYIPAARDQTFNEINEAVLVVAENDRIIDVNHSAQNLFGSHVIGNTTDKIIPNCGTEDTSEQEITLDIDGREHHFLVRTSSVDYGRDLRGNVISLTDITKLKQQEQELELLKEILSRMLRHNIRNRLTAIQGHTHHIINTGDEDVVKRAKEINDISNLVAGQAEKASKIEGIITNDETVVHSLQELIKQVDLSSIPDSDTADIQVSVDDIAVEAHPEFPVAIQELVENAIIHNTKETAVIDIYAKCSKDDILLVIEDNGSGIPQHEIDVIRTGKETKLQHGSGIGLWLANWIINYSNGELLVETTETGTCVKIRLNRRETPE